MNQSEYEERRRQLDAQLRAEVELLYQAYLVRLRALETLQLGGGHFAGFPLQLPAPPGLAELLPSPAAGSPATPAPPPVPQKRRASSFTLFETVANRLDELGDTFDKTDVCRVLGYEPNRATLYRVFQLLQQDGAIEVDTAGTGKVPTRYRRVYAQEE